MNVSHSDVLVFFGATAGSILVITHMSNSMLKIIIPLFVFVLFAATSAAQSCSRKMRFGCPSQRDVS